MIYSKHREIIMRALLENPVHPTADELYHILKPEHPSLSLATVYRNLNQLAQNGKVRKIEVPSGSDRFDGTLDAHYHMVCEKCGGITDLPDGYVPEMNAAAIDGMGISVERSNIMFYGVCPACGVGNRS